MTFYEAALEVLRREARPLNYKKITEIAIRENLLDHVGKQPQLTMSARLDRELKRGEFSDLIKVRPNVVQLREEVAEAKNAEAAEREALEAELAAQAQEELAAEQSDAEELETEEVTDAKQMDYPEDPELFDAKDEDEEAKPERSRRRRRRGRGRGRGRNSDRDQAAREEQAEQAEQEDAQPEPEEQPAAQETPVHAEKPERSGRGGRGRGGRGGRGRGERSERSERNERSDKPRERRESKPRERRDHNKRSHLQRGPVRLEGIAQAAYSVLKDLGEPATISTLSDEIYKRKLVKFHTHDRNTTIQAAIVNDNHQRSNLGHRGLFARLTENRWGLTEWGLAEDTLRKEQQILSLSEECRQDAIAHLGQALLEVKPEALEQLTLTLLERMDYRNIKVSKRSSEGDVFFSADWRQGLSDVRVCIQLVGESDTELGSKAVTDLRGTLHHYAANNGVIIHFGDIEKEAVAECREDKLAPITLIDRKTFVGLLVKQGIGVKHYTAPVLMVDTEYIDQLKS